MKKALLLILGILYFQTAAAAETFTVQPENSAVKWTASKITGTHNGSISVKSGTVEFEGDVFTGGQAVIDTTSLTVEDLQGGGKAKLEGHLKDPDFFMVETYPEATLKITEAKPAGGTLYDVTADLTIKNITKPITFQADISKTSGAVTAKAALKIDRTAYDIRYGSGKFFENLGDKTIHDEFTLDVSITAAA